MKRSDRRRRRLLAAGAALFILAATLTGFFLVRSAAQERNFAEARHAGLAHHKEGRYADAIPHLSYVVRRDPADVEVLLAFAEARSRIPLENDRHLGEAIALYLAVVQNEPRQTAALDALLELYERTGRRLEWMETADRVLALDANHVVALRAKARGYAIVSDFDQASEYTSRLIQLEPNELRWRVLHLQVLHDDQRPTHELLAVCDDWIDEVERSGWESDGRYHMLKASVLSSAGKREDARHVARIAASAERGALQADVLRQMLALLDALQLRVEAEELIELTKSRFPYEHWPVEARVRRYWQHGRAADGLMAIEAWQDVQGTLSTALMRWNALLHIQRNELEQARNVLSTLQEPTALEPEVGRDAHRAWIEAVNARIEVADAGDRPAAWREALDIYRGSIALAPDDPLLHYLIGEAQLHVGEDELAAVSLERAARNDPSWIAAQVLYTESLLRLGRSETAAHLAAGLLRRIEQPSFSMYLLFARAWMASGLGAEEFGIVSAGAPDGDAITPAQFLEALRAHAPDELPAAESAQVVQLLIERLLQDGQRERASQVVQDVLAEDAPEPAVLISMARASSRANLGFEQQLLDRAVAEIGMTLEIAEVQARILHQRGQSGDGRRLLEDVLESHADDVGRDVAQRVLAAYLVWINSPDATAALHDVLDGAAGLPHDIAFVLMQEATWRDAALALRGVDLLADALGESSVRVALARATYILHFERSQPATMARALVLVNDVLYRAPDSLGALTLMSALHLASNPPDVIAASRQLQRAVRAHPRRADLYPQLIALLQRQGDFDSAQTYLARLGELSSRHENIRRTELQLLESQGDFQAIITRLGEQLSGLTSEEDRAILLASLHRAGRFVEAEAIAAELLDLPSLSPESLGVLARFLADSGRIDEMQAMLQQREELREFERAWLLGSVQKHAGLASEAENTLLEAVRISPDDPRGWRALADLYLQAGEHREARRAARSGLEADPENRSLKTTLVLASLNLSGSARQEAFDLLEALGREDRALAATLSLYARITSRENAAPAARDLGDALRLVREFPSYLPAWRLAIAAHTQAGSLERAADLADRATHRFPNKPEPARLAAQLFAELDQPQRALGMAELWRSRSLNRPLAADVMIAALQLELGRASLAMDHLDPLVDRIVAERTARPEAMRTLARTMIHARATDRLVNVLALFNESGEDVWEFLASGVADNAPLDSKAKLLEEMERPAQGNARGQLALAQLWIGTAARTGESQHFDKALHHAREAARLDASVTVHARLLQGVVSDFRNDLAAAEEHYRHVLETEPEHALAMNNLAHVLLRRAGSPDEAVQLSQRALALMPGHPDVLDTHALALLAAGEAQKAESFAAAALGQRPNDPAALLTLARVFLAQDRAADANESFRQASQALSSRGASAHVREQHRHVEKALLAANLDDQAKPQ